MQPKSKIQQKLTCRFFFPPLKVKVLNNLAYVSRWNHQFSFVSVWVFVCVCCWNTKHYIWWQGIFIFGFIFCTLEKVGSHYGLRHKLQWWRNISSYRSVQFFQASSFPWCYRSYSLIQVLKGWAGEKWLINKLISLKSTKNIRGLENGSLLRCLHYVLKTYIFFFLFELITVPSPRVSVLLLLFLTFFCSFWGRCSDPYHHPSTSLFSLFSPCTE